MPTGTIIHNIELREGKGAKMCRSAGTSATLLQNEDEKGRALVRLPSGVPLRPACAGATVPLTN
jgi:large subunit ribosomal protein L2